MARCKLTNVCAVILSALAALAISTNAVSQQVTEVVRVDGENGSANPPGQGDDWGVDAYKYLQDGLDRADVLIDQGADTVEIWVAAVYDENDDPVGYRPDQGANYTEGDRTESFELRNNVELYGGFFGDELARAERNVSEYETVLTGFLGEPLDSNCCNPKPGQQGCDDQDCEDLVCDSDPFCCDIEWDSTCVSFAEDNCDVCTFDFGHSLHVVASLQGIDSSALLSGFTVADGYATGDFSTLAGGGGMLVYESSPGVSLTTFRNNRGEEFGGALYQTQGDVDPSGAPLIIHNCTFFDNHAVGTDSAGRGGAMMIQRSNVEIANTLIHRNSADNYAGAMVIQRTSHATITNSTIVQNAAVEDNNPCGQGLCGVGGIAVQFFATADIVNSIIWENEFDGDMSESQQLSGSGITVDYTCIQDLQSNWGSNNIGLDPEFVDPYDPDEPDFRLWSSSPAIDAADDSEAVEDVLNVLDDPSHDPKNPGIAPDLDLTDRIVNVAVDMGAYEFPFCTGDIDGNGDVGGDDLGLLLSDWGPCDDCADCRSDLNGDCEVDGQDLGLLLSDWDCPHYEEDAPDTGGTQQMGLGGPYGWLETATLEEVIEWLNSIGWHFDL